MKISSGLVFDKYSGEIIGFTSSEDEELTEVFMGNDNNLASHALIVLEVYLLTFIFQ